MRLSFRGRTLIFVDVEASGLHRHSYPVEIGWCDDDEGPPASFLIRPHAGWPRTAAYDAGRAIHGIDYADLLAKGLPLPDVVKRLKAAWTDAILVSDAVLQDTRWIAAIYAARDEPMPWKLVEYDVVFSALHQWAGTSVAEATAAVEAAKRRLAVPHRAGPDALRLHRICRAVIDPAWRAVLTDPPAVAAGTPAPKPAPLGPGAKE